MLGAQSTTGSVASAVDGRSQPLRVFRYSSNNNTNGGRPGTPSFAFPQRPIDDPVPLSSPHARMQHQPARWSPQLESLALDLGQKAKIWAVMHRRTQQWFSAMHTWIKVPACILGAITASSVFVVLDDSCVDMSMGFSWVVKGLSVASVVTTALLAKLNYAARAAKHGQAHMVGESLHERIQQEVLCHPDDRIPADEFMASIHASLNQIRNVPHVPQSIVRKYVDQLDVVLQDAMHLLPQQQQQPQQAQPPQQPWEVVVPPPEDVQIRIRRDSDDMGAIPATAHDEDVWPQDRNGGSGSSTGSSSSTSSSSNSPNRSNPIAATAQRHARARTPRTAAAAQQRRRARRFLLGDIPLLASAVRHGDSPPEVQPGNRSSTASGSSPRGPPGVDLSSSATSSSQSSSVAEGAFAIEQRLTAEVGQRQERVLTCERRRTQTHDAQSQPPPLLRRSRSEQVAAPPPSPQRSSVVQQHKRSHRRRRHRRHDHVMSTASTTTQAPTLRRTRSHPSPASVVFGRSPARLDDATGHRPHRRPHNITHGQKAAEENKDEEEGEDEGCSGGGGGLS